MVESEMTDDEVKIPCPKLSMVEWFVRETAREQDVCIPCALPPVASWYKQTLEEAGEAKQVNKLEEAAASGNTLEIIQVMDAIKGSVPELLRERLAEFDCMIQATDLAALAKELEEADA